MDSLGLPPALRPTNGWPRLAIFVAGGLLIGIVIGEFMKWRAGGSDWPQYRRRHA
jgi:hypothetical protein